MQKDSVNSLQPDLDPRSIRGVSTDSELSIPANGATLYVINDTTYIRDVKVDEYKLVRWTEHNWFVMCRGSEKKIRKSRTTFINHDVLVEYLKKLKQQELESAQRRVTELSGELCIPTHKVPHERYSIPTEELKL